MQQPVFAKNSFIYFLMCMENALRQIIPPTAGRKMKSANQIRTVMSKGDQKKRAIKKGAELSSLLATVLNEYQ
ncbi:hypothetical protein ACSV5M_08245 [Cellvibrio sp. ARAG 10.3]|uniref:hypothetical protein n=1 Tax=Cellvibrio sp. ARAG 10.3 TaxID=3451358 RepID=UPI003F447D20